MNTTAFTNVDLCETEKKDVYKTNALAVEYIGEVCKELDILLCHQPTDYVFDGIKGDYVEEDRTNPINYYGYTKEEGELILNELNFNLISIIRISVPYCVSPIKVNFFTWVLNNLKDGKK